MEGVPDSVVPDRAAQKSHTSTRIKTKGTRKGRKKKQMGTRAHYA